MGFEKMEDSQAALDVDFNEKQPDFEENYDPHDQKPEGKSTSYLESVFILAKSSIGTGILCLPRAFYNAGYILGTVGTILAGILSTTTVHLISSSQYELCRRKRIPRMTYPEAVEAAFELGPGNSRRYKDIARKICHSFLALLEFGSDGAYAIFIGENIKEICDHFFTPQPLRFYLLCMLGPLILICWIRNLKYLAPVTSIGTGCAMGCVGVIYYYIFSQPITFEGRKPVGSVKEFAIFFGTALYAYGNYGIIVPLKNRMTKPRQFGSKWGIVNAVMFPNMIMYVVIGLFGYLAYGNLTKSSITLNLPTTGFVGDLIRILMAGSIFTTYPICNYVVIEQLWHKFFKLKMDGTKNLIFWEYVFRTTVTCANFIFCIAVPNLELVMSLVGSLMVPTLGIWLPSIMNTLTFWDSYSGLKFKLFLLRNIVIMLIGLFASAVSFTMTVREIIATTF